LIRVEFALRIRMRGSGGEVETSRQRLLDGAPAGRVVERGGESQAVVLAERVNALHQALAETRCAENGGAVVILHGAGDDLAGTGAFLVHENGELEAVRSRGLRHKIALLGDVPPAERDDFCAGLEEEAGRADGGGDESTGVVAQIQYQS